MSILLVYRYGFFLIEREKAKNGREVQGPRKRYICSFVCSNRTVRLLALPLSKLGLIKT